MLMMVVKKARLSVGARWWMLHDHARVAVVQRFGNRMIERTTGPQSKSSVHALQLHSLLSSNSLSA